MKKGIIASEGYAIGQVILKKYEHFEYKKKEIINSQIEINKLKEAIDKSRQELTILRDKTKSELGEEMGMIFESHIMILDDSEFTGAAFNNIESKKIAAETAIQEISDTLIDIFSKLQDGYMKERAEDIKDVTDRILRNLSGSQEQDITKLSPNSILVAHDLTPSDTVQLDRKKVIGFLTDIGGTTSHTAIMARTLEIPAVVGLKDITDAVKTGDIVIIDAVKGIVILNPDKDTIMLYKGKMAKFNKNKEELKKLVNCKAVTKNGKTITVAGNINSPQDIHNVINNGGDSIGLFRTEFLYMNGEALPGEEEQFKTYKYVTEEMQGKPVIIRTLDIGGDKKLPYLELPEELNPFLGCRAIRLCLDRRDIFKTQLRAILRASAFGNINIMFPMISYLEEYLEALKLLQQCMDELKNEKIPFNQKIQTGIMVEIPSAAIMAEEFAKYVDFFSIGTNDLIQYTLAVDRMNEKVSYLYNPFHPAVLKLIKMTIDAAHKEGKWCGMCGEMAGDEAAIATLLGYGLDEFSVSAASILKVKKIIINT